MDEYQQRRQALYDQITELLANSGLPWYQARSVLMQIKQDIFIAEGMKSSKEMVDVIRSARGNDPIEKKPGAATPGSSQDGM